MVAAYHVGSESPKELPVVELLIASDADAIFFDQGVIGRMAWPWPRVRRKLSSLETYVIF